MIIVHFIVVFVVVERNMTRCKFIQCVRRITYVCDRSVVQFFQLTVSMLSVLILEIFIIIFHVI